MQAATLKAILFVALVCLSLLGTGVWAIWKSHATDLQDAATVTTNMARALAQHADDTLRAADTILVGLVERLETEDMASASLPRIKKMLQLSVAELPSLHGMFVYDEAGRAIVTPQSIPASPMDNSDREYLQYHRINIDRGAHVGVPIQSRATGKWVVPVSRRINHPDGTFAGVVLATVEMDYFRKYHEIFDIGPNGAILLALDNGTLIARRPFDKAMIGRNVSSGPVFTQLRSAGPGTRMLVSAVDNVERLYSYRLIAHYPLVVATALSKDDILANWRHEACRTAAVILSLIAVIGWLGARLVKQISVRERTEAELREAKQTLEQLNLALEMLSFEDSLTGLGNRRRFDVSLVEECRNGARYQTALALIMIDVDHFKRYNDLYGHPAGDECLRLVGAAIRAARVRTCDVVARYGGEEIAVLLPQTGREGALAAAERIRHCVEALGIAHAGSPFGYVTISLGVAAFVPVSPDDAATRLLANADRALYTAKGAGRNQARFVETAVASVAPLDVA